MDFTKEVIRAEQDLLKIKATQKTQNDSNLLYVYRVSPPTTYDSNFVWTKYEFIPAKGTYDNIICQFNIDAGYAIQASETIEVLAEKPWVAYSQAVFDPSSSSLPSFMNWCYIWCYTNVAGELRATKVEHLGD